MESTTVHIYPMGENRPIVKVVITESQKRVQKFEKIRMDVEKKDVEEKRKMFRPNLLINNEYKSGDSGPLSESDSDCDKAIVAEENGKDIVFKKNSFINDFRIQRPNSSFCHKNLLSNNLLEKIKSKNALLRSASSIKGISSSKSSQTHNLTRKKISVSGNRTKKQAENVEIQMKNNQICPKQSLGKFNELREIILAPESEEDLNFGLFKQRI